MRITKACISAFEPVGKNARQTPATRNEAVLITQLDAPPNSCVAETLPSCKVFRCRGSKAPEERDVYGTSFALQLKLLFGAKCFCCAPKGAPNKVRSSKLPNPMSRGGPLNERVSYQICGAQETRPHRGAGRRLDELP